MTRHLNSALRSLPLVLMVASSAALAGAPALAAGKKARPRPVVTQVIPPEPPDLIEPPLPMGYDWSGFYAGGFAGGAHGLWTVDFFRNNNHGHAEEGLDGAEFGVYAGYNTYISPNIIAGAEIDLGHTNASQMNNVFDNDTSFASYSTFGSLRGRLGYAIDRVMLYGTVGLAFANITNDIQKGANAGEQVVWDDQTRLGN